MKGGDTWAVHNGWVSVTPLSLRQDVLTHETAPSTFYSRNDAVVAATAAIIAAVAAEQRLKAGGLPAGNGNGVAVVAATKL